MMREVVRQLLTFRVGGARVLLCC